MTKYRKKPVVVEAIRYDPEAPPWFPEEFGPPVLMQPLRSFAPGYIRVQHTGNVTHGGPAQYEPVVLTLEGPLRISPGDWIVKGVKGEFYPVKPDIFEETYEAIDE